MFAEGLHCIITMLISYITCPLQLVWPPTDLSIQCNYIRRNVLLSLKLDVYYNSLQFTGQTTWWLLYCFSGASSSSSQFLYGVRLARWSATDWFSAVVLQPCQSSDYVQIGDRHLLPTALCPLNHFDWICHNPLWQPQVRHGLCLSSQDQTGKAHWRLQQECSFSRCSSIWLPASPGRPSTLSHRDL